MKKIFVPVVGQFTNVGDVMHRKELLSWLRNSGKLHVYIGNAPADFVEGLQLPTGSKLYTNLYKWLWQIVTSPYKKTHFVFNPGEITFRNKRLLGEIMLLPFELIVRLKKGQILRVGVAAMSNVEIKNKTIWKFLFSFSSKIYWRTLESQKLFKMGEVIPDLAFAGDNFRLSDGGQRRLLTLSMRVDRPLPGRQWFDAIQTFAEQNQLQMVVVSQVRMDNPRSKALADTLGAKCFLWEDNIGHLQQESSVREIYRETEVVVSDRLHVLIAASSDGAIPSVVLTKPSDKVKHHFDVIELGNIALFSTDTQEMLKFLEVQLQRKKDVHAKIAAAQERLSKIKEEVIKILS